MRREGGAWTKVTGERLAEELASAGEPGSSRA
jgi:hypothetical protein